MTNRIFIKYCDFSKILETSPSPALGCYWLYKKLPANRSDYTRIALRALKVPYSDVGDGGVAVNCEKKTIFPEHPVCTGCAKILD